MSRPVLETVEPKKKASPFLKISLWVSFLVGLTLFIGLIVYQGAGEVMSALTLVGWGSLLVLAIHLVVMALGAMSIWPLIPARQRPSMLRIFWIWWIGISVNVLLPVAQVGGELVRARLLARSRVPGPQAGAVMVVALTATVLTLVLLAAIALVILGAGLGQDQDGMILRITAGLVIFASLFLGFYLAQRGGLFLWLGRAFERMASGREWAQLVGGAEALDREIVSLYRRPGAFAACCMWRVSGWLLDTVEVWVILYLMGHPVSFAEAFVLESLARAIKSAGFAIPGGLGVQEGGYLVIGGLLGIPGHVALALSLVKRVRDLLISLPGLGAWQIFEGRSVFQRVI
jgi:putative membrane protein